MSVEQRCNVGENKESQE